MRRVWKLKESTATKYTEDNLTSQSYEPTENIPPFSPKILHLYTIHECDES